MYLKSLSVFIPFQNCIRFMFRFTAFEFYCWPSLFFFLSFCYKRTERTVWPIKPGASRRLVECKCARRQPLGDFLLQVITIDWLFDSVSLSMIIIVYLKLTLNSWICWVDIEPKHVDIPTFLEFLDQPSRGRGGGSVLRCVLNIIACFFHFNAKVLRMWRARMCACTCACMCAWSMCSLWELTISFQCKNTWLYFVR